LLLRRLTSRSRSSRLRELVARGGNCTSLTAAARREQAGSVSTARLQNPRSTIAAGQLIGHSASSVGSTTNVASDRSCRDVAPVYRDRARTVVDPRTVTLPFAGLDDLLRSKTPMYARSSDDTIRAYGSCHSAIFSGGCRLATSSAQAVPRARPEPNRGSVCERDASGPAIYAPSSFRTSQESRRRNAVSSRS